MNIKTKEILALEVTDEKVHDGKVMRKLVKHVLNNHDEEKVRIKSVLSDGAYDSNENFRFLNDKRIKPAIKVRKKFNHFIQKQQDEEQRSQTANKRFPQMEKEEKVWTEVDC